MFHFRLQTFFILQHGYVFLFTYTLVHISVHRRPSNKVGVHEPADTSGTDGTPSEPHPHRSSVHHGETDDAGPSIREKPHLPPPSSNRGPGVPPRVGPPRPSNRVLTVAPMETIDI